jgi:broad specificity phosphatase PhoE
LAAEIAFKDRALRIIRDARLRECDYGTLSRRSTLEIEKRRAFHVDTPFPNGESYQQVVGRVSTWLTEVMLTFGGRTVLVIGHRATFYALEHLVRHVPLHEAVTSAWHWQPGWTYRGLRGGHASP